jgi:hypothetical protein
VGNASREDWPGRLGVFFTKKNTRHALSNYGTAGRPGDDGYHTLEDQNIEPGGLVMSRMAETQAAIPHSRCGGCAGEEEFHEGTGYACVRGDRGWHSNDPIIHTSETAPQR